MKYVLVLIIVFTALGYAGQSDYVDSVVTEMKNNGEYYRLSENHPEWTDKQLVEYYEAQKGEAAR